MKNIFNAQPIGLSTEGTAQLYPGILNGIDPEIKIAATLAEVNKIEQFRDKYYRFLYPETYHNKPDPYYNNGIHCYVTDENSNIVATMSFAFDCEGGLPDEHLFSSQIAFYKENDIRYMEVGRMLVAKCERHEAIKRKLYKFIYYGGRAIGVNKVLTLYKAQKKDFYSKTVGVKVIDPDTGHNFGSKNNYASLEWSLDETLPGFFDWVNEINITDNINPSGNVMGDYSHSHLTLTSSFQSEVYRDVSALLYGNVLDLGCGTAKMAAFLADNRQVLSYTGIDISAPMLAKAKLVLNKVNRKGFSVQLCEITEHSAKGYDSAACICSYQFWQEQEKTLKHICTLLNKGATLVLAAPNQHQDLALLAKEVRKEQIGHPDLEVFIQFNLALKKETVTFTDMVTMREQVEGAGFEICSAHQNYYLGGLNYLVLRKR